MYGSLVHAIYANTSCRLSVAHDLIAESILISAINNAKRDLHVFFFFTDAHRTDLNGFIAGRIARSVFTRFSRESSSSIDLHGSIDVLSPSPSPLPADRFHRARERAFAEPSRVLRDYVRDGRTSGIRNRSSALRQPHRDAIAMAVFLRSCLPAPF